MFWHGMVPHVEKVLYYSQFDPNGMKGVVFVHRGDQLFFENFWHLPIWPCFYLDTIKAFMPMVENGLKRPIQVRDNDGHFNNRNVYTNNTIHIKGAGHSQLVIVRFLSIIKVKRYLTGSNIIGYHYFSLSRQALHTYAFLDLLALDVYQNYQMSTDLSLPLIFLWIFKKM